MHEIAEFRAFNRFHTNLVGALDERLLDCDVSLPQARVIYEIATAPTDAPVTATRLGAQLRLDAGYMSRLVSGLEARGLIERRQAPDNAKRLILALTPAGEILFQALNAGAIAEIRALLDPLPRGDQTALVGAMRRIRKLLGDRMPERPIMIREPRPGDLGVITSRQAKLYADEYGWDWTFEGLVAEIVGKFVQTFDPKMERAWIAEYEGEIVGSVLVVKEDDATAKLRLLYVDKLARGKGLGGRLVDETMAFARSAGYRRMVLWTNDCLVSARKIYEAAGFELVKSEPHHSFGKDLVGQYWGRDL
jgi:DNA-binding MarR family transcriptional regulator/GNAT superfamily N-acetyltransferase